MNRHLLDSPEQHHSPHDLEPVLDSNYYTWILAGTVSFPAEPAHLV